MRRFLLLFAVPLTAQVSFARNGFKVTVKDQETKEPVAGAKVSVKGTEVSALTFSAGRKSSRGRASPSSAA